MLDDHISLIEDAGSDEHIEGHQPGQHLGNFDADAHKRSRRVTYGGAPSEAIPAPVKSPKVIRRKSRNCLKCTLEITPRAPELLIYYIITYIQRVVERTR